MNGERINSNTADAERHRRNRRRRRGHPPDTVMERTEEFAEAIIIERVGTSGGASTTPQYQVIEHGNGELLASAPGWTIEGTDDLMVEDPSRRLQVHADEKRNNTALVFVENAGGAYRKIRVTKNGQNVVIQQEQPGT